MDSASQKVEPTHTAVRGRARFRVAGLHRNSRLEGVITDLLTREARVRRVSASALTGTVLVIFDPEHKLDAIAAQLERIACSGADPPAGPEPARQPDSQGAYVPSGHFAPLEEMGQPWHMAEIGSVLEFWRTERKAGLSIRDATGRLQKYGPNVLPRATARSTLAILLSQFQSLPVILLLGSAVLSIATGGFADAAFIVGVIALNATIGTVTERNSERLITTLTEIGQPPAMVLRDGAIREIPSEEVVPGDVLVLTRGSYVSADGRLLEVVHLTVDESVLTGESVAASKIAAVLNSEALPLGDRVNMVYRGTVVTGGSGLAVVVATATHTEIGKIQRLIGSAESPETPLQRQMEQLGRQLVFVATGVCGLVFAAGMLRGMGVLQMLRTSISLAVAAIPEGLPTVATTTLAFGIQNLRRRNVLVRQLDAVEALGSVQVMCLDKTGTITMNRMTAVAAFAGMKHFDIRAKQFLLGGEPASPLAHPELLRVLRIGALCNESEIAEEHGSVVLKGSPTETALVQAALDTGIDVTALRRRYPLRRIEYRAENRNYMSTEHDGGKGKTLVAMKGSPAEVLALCDRFMIKGRRRPLTDAERADIKAANERMASGALRVLGVAHKEWFGSRPQKEDGFVWLGMVGVMDPPRSGVSDVIRVFRQAGIQVMMITGDQSATAYAVGRELGLGQDGHIEILDSTRLEELDPELLSALVTKVDIFSRVSPSQKLQIVRALQHAGKMVAMTGDGVNDGPALKAADIGVAMGRGSEVAREVADVVLMDDNIATMIGAIEQGRTTRADIRKAVHFMASTNLSEILVELGAVGGGLGQGLNPRQLLWINLLTDVFPELALAVDPPESEVLKERPSDPAAPFFTAREFRRIALESGIITSAVLLCYGAGVRRYGIGPQASTMAFLTTATAQLLHAITTRSETHSIFDPRSLPRNTYVPMALGAGLLVELLSLVLPGLRRLLGTARISGADLAICCGASMGSFLVNEIWKSAARRRAIGAVAPAGPVPEVEEPVAELDE